MNPLAAYQKPRRSTRSSSLVWSTLLCLILACSSGLAENKSKSKKKSSPSPVEIVPHDADFQEKSLSEWLGIYWRWNLDGADPAQSLVDGVKLLPIPNGELIGGDFSAGFPALLRGEMEITLPAGTPFVLPAFAWLSEKYEDDSLDAVLPDEVLKAAVHPDLKIDDQPILSDENKGDFYVSDPFDPVVEYAAPSDYGSVGAVTYQSSGFIALPLSKGEHRIHLYETFIIKPEDYPQLAPAGLGVIYDNTWIIKVKSKKKKQSKK